MSDLRDVCSCLDGAGVPFALIGAAALAVHGISRSTLDVDLLVTDSRTLDEGFWAGLEVDVRRGDAEDPLAGVVRVGREAVAPVDVIVGRARWQSDAIARAIRTVVSGVCLPVVTAADLVLLKLYAGGAQDLWDVREILAAHDEAFRETVEARLDPLPGRCRALWETLG